MVHTYIATAIMDVFLLFMACFTSQILHIKSTNTATALPSILLDRKSDMTLNLALLFSLDTSTVLECTMHCLIVDGCSAIIGSPDSPKCRGFSGATGTQTHNVGPSDKLYTSALESVVKECPAGYNEFASIKVCYKRGADMKTQSQAESTCQADGGTLMSLHTPDRYNALSSYLRLHHPYSEHFINAKKIGGIWKWGDGSTIDTASHINPYVNIMMHDDCLFIKEDYWYGTSCLSTRNYICEYEL